MSGWRRALAIVAGATAIFATVVGLGFVATRGRALEDGGADAAPSDDVPELEPVE